MVTAKISSSEVAEEEVVNYLKKEIKNRNPSYGVETQIKVGPHLADIVVFDQQGKIREVYEVKANSGPESLQHAAEMLSLYAAYLGMDCLIWKRSDQLSWRMIHL